VLSLLSVPKCQKWISFRSSLAFGIGADEMMGFHLLIALAERLTNEEAKYPAERGD
jgi:hypothetical protein